NPSFVLISVLPPPALRRAQSFSIFLSSLENGVLLFIMHLQLELWLGLLLLWTLTAAGIIIVIAGTWTSTMVGIIINVAGILTTARIIVDTAGTSTMTTAAGIINDVYV